MRELAGFKLGLSVALFAFFLNYFQTPFFWDVLHMHYGFRTVLGNLICLEVYRHLVAPYFTTVVPGANGLRDFATSCLVPATG